MSDSEAPLDDANATLAAWRERGDARVNPVRFRMIEALARRAAGHDGQARHLLDEKLAALMTSYAAEVAQAGEKLPAVQAPARTDKAAPAAQPRGAMRSLLDYIRQHAPSHTNAPQPAAEALSTAPGELETLRYLRSTWSRLSADKHLTQSLAKVPDKPGPLNSHHLLHRALAAMRETSPEYFHRFVSYVDGLLALDQMTQPAPAAAPAAESTTPARARKSSRSSKAG